MIIVLTINGCNWLSIIQLIQLIIFGAFRCKLLAYFALQVWKGTRGLKDGHATLRRRIRQGRGATRQFFIQLNPRRNRIKLVWRDRQWSFLYAFEATRRIVNCFCWFWYRNLSNSNGPSRPTNQIRYLPDRHQIWRRESTFSDYSNLFVSFSSPRAKSMVWQ